MMMMMMYVCRLSALPPSHLALCPGAGSREREAARLAASCLRAMCARVPPGELAGPKELREAMGVSLTHLGKPTYFNFQSNSFIPNIDQNF